MANGQDQQPDQQPQEQVVEAVGTAGPRGATGKEIERVMAEAATQAMAEGITDPEEIKARKLQAREDLKARYAEEAAAREQRAQETNPSNQQGEAPDFDQDRNAPR